MNGKRKQKHRIDAVIGIDVGEFMAQTMAWRADEVGELMRHIGELCRNRNWVEIREPFRVLRRGTARRPSVTVADRLRVISAGECAYCGSKEMLTVDHIIPLSRGGPHALHNFQCLCFPCNRDKADKLEVVRA